MAARSPTWWRRTRETAPYKWNGHNPDLATQCGPRIAKFLFRSEGFNTQELEALLTYINYIPLAPNRHLAPDGQLTDAQERGKDIFYRQYTNDGRVIPCPEPLRHVPPGRDALHRPLQHRRGISES